MDIGLRSNQGQLSEKLGNLQKAGTYAEHIKGAQSLLDFVDRNRPALAQTAHESGKLSRLFEKYEKKIRMQQNDPDKELSSSEIAKDFFLANTLDNTKAADVKVIELKYLTRLRNPPLNPRQFLGSRPLSNSAYKNYLHWSRKSIMLEQKMRTFYDISNPKVVQDHVLLMSCLENNTFLPVVDTFWSIDVDSTGDEIIDRPIHRLQSADHFDWKRNNIIKTAHHPSEIDSLVLSAVNDFLSYQKLARASFLGLPPISKPPVKKGKSFLTDNENHAINHTNDEKHEGDCKVEAILVAETIDGCQHVRPLCTTSDVALAMYELADPEIFDRGFLQLPHTLNMHYDRWMEGYYRYMYRAKEDSYLEYVEPILPSDHADVANFLFPAAMCEYKDVHVTKVSSVAIPGPIRDFCDSVVSAFYNAYQSVGQVVLSMDFDFEAIVVGCPPFPKDIPRAPHRVHSRSGWEFQYRATCFRNVKSQVSFSSLRRNAVAGLDGMKKSFLKQFHSFFVEALHKLESNEHAFVGNGEDRNLPKLMGYQAARKIFLSIQEEEDSDSSDNGKPELNANTANNVTDNMSVEEVATKITEDLLQATDEQEKKERFSVQLLKKYHRNKIREERRESHAKLGEKAKEDRRMSLALLREKQDFKPLSQNDSDDSDDSSSSASSSNSSFRINKNDRRRSSFRPGGKAALFLGHNRDVKRRRPIKVSEEDEKAVQDEELKQRFLKEKQDKQEEALSNWITEEALAQLLSPTIKLDTNDMLFHDLLGQDSFFSMDMNNHVRALLAETFPIKSKKRSIIDKLSVPQYPSSPFDVAVGTDTESFLNLKNLVDYTKEVKLAEDMEKSVADFCRKTDILELLSNDEITKRLKDKKREIASVIDEKVPEEIVDDAEQKRLLAILDTVQAAELRGKVEVEKSPPSKRNRKLKSRKEKVKSASPPKVQKVDKTNPDEIEKTLQSILQLLNPELATKLRKGLNNYLSRLRHNKTKKFIMRRRRQESLTEQQVNDLSRFYYSLPQDSNSSGSSDDEKKEKDNKKKDSPKKPSEDPHALDSFNLSELIGDLAHEDHLQSLIQARVAETNMEKALQQQQIQQQKTAVESISRPASRPTSRPFSPSHRVKTPSTANSTAPSSADPTGTRLSMRTTTPKSADSARARASLKSNQRLSTRVAVPSVLIDAGDIIAVDESQRRKEAMSSFYYNLFHPSSNNIVSETASTDVNIRETPRTAASAASTIDSSRVPTRDGQEENRPYTVDYEEQKHPISPHPVMPKRNSLWGPAVIPSASDKSSENTGNAGDDIISKVLREMKWEEELRQRRQALILQQQSLTSQDNQEHANKLRQVVENYRSKNGNLKLRMDDDVSDGEQDEQLIGTIADTFPRDALPSTKSSFALNMPSPSPNNGRMSPSVGNRTRSPSMFLIDMKDEPIARLQFIGSTSFIVQTPTSPTTEDENSGLSGTNSPSNSSRPQSTQQLKRILPPQVSISSVTRPNDTPTVAADAASSAIIESYIESLSRPSSTASEKKPRPNSPRPRNRSKTRISSFAEPIVDESPQSSTNQQLPDVSLPSAYPAEDHLISTMVEKVANFFKNNVPESPEMTRSILVDPIVEEPEMKEEDLLKYEMIVTDDGASENNQESIIVVDKENFESTRSKTISDSITTESHLQHIHARQLEQDASASYMSQKADSGKNLDNFTEISYNDIQDEVLFDNTLIPLIYLPSPDNIRHDPLVQSIPNQQHQAMVATISRAVTAMQHENQDPFVQVPIRPETSAATFVDGRVYPKSRFGRKISESNEGGDKQATLKPRIPSRPRPSSAGFTGRKQPTSTSDIKEAVHQPTSNLAVAFGFSTEEKKQKKERQHAVAIPDARNDVRPKIGLLGQTIQPSGGNDKSTLPSISTCLNPEWYSTAAQLETTQIKASLASNPSLTPHHPRDQLPTHISVASTTPVVYHIPIPQPARLPITVLPEPNIPSLSPPVVHMRQATSMSPDVTRVGLNTNSPSPSAATSARRSPSPSNNNHYHAKKKQVRIVEEDVNLTNRLSLNLSSPLGKEIQPLEIPSEDERYDLPFKIEVVRGLKTSDHAATMSCESSSLDKTNISTIVMLSPTGGTHVRTFSFDDTYVDEDASVFDSDTAVQPHLTEKLDSFPITSSQLEEQSNSIVSDIAAKLLQAPDSLSHLAPEMVNDPVSLPSTFLKGDSSTSTEKKSIEKNSISSILLGKGGGATAEYIPDFFVLPDLSLYSGEPAIVSVEDENITQKYDQHHELLWQKEFESMEYSRSVASAPPVTTAAPPKSTLLSPKVKKRKDENDDQVIVSDKDSVVPDGVLLHAASTSSWDKGNEDISATVSLENMPAVNASLEDTSLTPLLASGSMSPSHTIAGIRGLNSSLASLSVISNSSGLPDVGQLDRLIESIPNGKTLKKRKDPLKAFHFKDKNKTTTLLSEGRIVSNKTVHHTPTVEPLLLPEDTNTSSNGIPHPSERSHPVPPPSQPPKRPTTTSANLPPSTTTAQHPRKQQILLQHNQKQQHHQDVPSVASHIPALMVVNQGNTSFAPANSQFDALTSFLSQQQQEQNKKLRLESVDKR